MYNTRKRLIECLDEARSICAGRECEKCCFAESGCFSELAAIILLGRGAIFAFAECEGSVHWIPTSERLPSEEDASEDKTVYAMFRSGHVVKAHWTLLSSETGIGSDVAYWRPVD